MVERLAVMMPVYNEVRTVAAIVRQVLRQPDVAQLVIVDDGSSDGTAEVLRSLAESDARVTLLHHDVNRGKGAALRAAIDAVQMELAIVQDADLEYDPADYAALLEPIRSGRADVVYGVRGFAGGSAYSYWFVKGNQLVTFAANVLYNTYISDLETGFKLLRTDLWRALGLREERFDIEPEITARVLRAGYRIHEVPIRYYARSREEGKKLTWRDGVRALATLIRLRVTARDALFERATWAYHRGRREALARRHPLLDV